MTAEVQHATVAQAKKLMKEELERERIGFDKITARTVSFVDFARDNMVFVSVHYLAPCDFAGLQQFAREHGFRLE